MTLKKQVIFSLEQTISDGEPMFWNNDTGWGSLDCATVFNEGDDIDAPMPDGQLVNLPDLTTAMASAQ